MAVSVQFQSSFRAVSGQFQSIFRAVSEQLQDSPSNWIFKKLKFWRWRFQCSFRAVSEQFQSIFRAVSGQFQGSFRAVPQVVIFNHQNQLGTKAVSEQIQCNFRAVPGCADDLWRDQQRWLNQITITEMFWLHLTNLNQVEVEIIWWLTDIRNDDIDSRLNQPNELWWGIIVV